VWTDPASLFLRWLGKFVVVVFHLKSLKTLQWKEKRNRNLDICFQPIFPCWEWQRMSSCVKRLCLLRVMAAPQSPPSLPLQRIVRTWKQNAALYFFIYISVAFTFSFSLMLPLLLSLSLSHSASPALSFCHSQSHILRDWESKGNRDWESDGNWDWALPVSTISINPVWELGVVGPKSSIDGGTQNSIKGINLRIFIYFSFIKFFLFLKSHQFGNCS